MPEGLIQPDAGIGQPIAENGQVQALLALLQEDNAPGCREFAELVRHVSGMERQLSDALEELQAVRRKMQEVQDHSLKAILQKSSRALEGNVDAMRLRLSELKGQIIEGCRNILEDFKERGAAALDGTARFFHLKPALEAVQNAAGNSIQACDSAVSRLDAFSKEYHEAGLHLKNMGRSLMGKPAETEIKDSGKIARAFTGAFVVERVFAAAVSRRAGQAVDALARLERAAGRRPSVLEAMREQTAKTEPEKKQPAPSHDKGSR